MEAGHRDELVQDAPLLGPPAVAVSLDDRRHEFIPRRHAHPPHRYLPDPIQAGSISDEATAQHSGTFLARQCDFDDAMFARSAAAFDNPDHVDIVVHNYRWRLGLVEGERKYDELEKRLAAGPTIGIPTITLKSDANGAPH